MISVRKKQIIETLKPSLFTSTYWILLYPSRRQNVLFSKRTNTTQAINLQRR